MHAYWEEEDRVRQAKGSLAPVIQAGRQGSIPPDSQKMWKVYLLFDSSRIAMTSWLNTHKTTHFNLALVNLKVELINVNDVNALIHRLQSLLNLEQTKYANSSTQTTHFTLGFEAEPKIDLTWSEVKIWEKSGLWSKTEPIFQLNSGIWCSDGCKWWFWFWVLHQWKENKTKNAFHWSLDKIFEF